MISDSGTLPYLAGLRLEGRRVVVVGAGRVAARRLAALARAGARIEVIAPAADEEIVTAAGAGRLTWFRRPYRSGDLRGAWYAMAATEDPDCNAAVVAEAEQRRVFCVRVDDASGGNAWTPATEVSGEVIIGLISVHPEQHRDPAKTKELRDRLVEHARDLQERQRGHDG